jgi:cell fate (sporulation/competence/biofilm development) regulator YlbF (YheA/YmcA/DUF963 family)
MDRINDKLKELVLAILESPEYQELQKVEAEVISTPGLTEQIKEFCWKNYELQNSEEEDLYERMEEFEKEYQEFRSNPVVTAYLEQELKMCRILQAINARITNAIELVL